jgi:hypothetical protein
MEERFMAKGPKIKVTIQPSADNEIQFYDALNGAADKLKELAEQALKDGDHEQFKGTHHIINANNDDGDDVGDIVIGD